MKQKVSSVFDLFTYVLRSLNTVETRLINEFGHCTEQISSTLVRHEIDEYLSGVRNNLLAIERIFSYLMTTATAGKDHLVQDLVHELTVLFSNGSQPYLKEMFVVTSLRSICAYKHALYHTAYQIAVELELDTPADILQGLLDKEKKAYESFDKLTFTQFTNVQ